MPCMAPYATPMAPENRAVYLGHLASSCGEDITTASVTIDLDDGTVELVHAIVSRKAGVSHNPGMIVIGGNTI